MKRSFASCNDAAIVVIMLLCVITVCVWALTLWAMKGCEQFLHTN